MKKYAVIYMDDTCPICTNKMNLIKAIDKGEKIPSHYECDNCGFTCHIYHSNENNIRPLYDSKLISEFKNNFKNYKIISI